MYSGEHHGNGALDAQMDLPKVTMWLRRALGASGPGEWRIDMVVASSASLNWTLSYKNGELLKDVIRGDVVRALEGYLPATCDAMVMSSSEFKLDLHNVILDRLTVASPDAREGPQRVHVTFRRVFGDLRGLFCANRVPNFVAEAENTISTRVLQDLLLPVLNLVETDPETATELSQRQLNAFIDRLKQNRQDIAFYSALITRYIANAQRSRPEVCGTSGQVLQALHSGSSCDFVEA